MSLPSVLANIFRSKQKSYKMVLILALLDEGAHGAKEVSLTKITERFRQTLLEREIKNLPVDTPPVNIGSSWQKASLQQMRSVITNPIEALSRPRIVWADFSKEMIGFHSNVLPLLNPSVVKELRALAVQEMEEYYQNQQPAPDRISPLISQLMNNYLKAKAESFSSHPLGTLLRQTLSQELQKLPFIDERYKVQGSVGMGNWANVPWIAIMDKRITETTQHGEYIVYLFSENMESVYLTLNQGVTVPLKQGRRLGYEYLEKRVKEIRAKLPLEGMQKDQNIFLTSSGLGKDYQVSTIAYIRYERDHLPKDDILIKDLKNMMENYEFYVQSQIEVDGEDGEEAMNKVSDRDVQNILQQIKSYITRKGFTFPEHLIENYYLSLRTKPFLILAGISGTGKTKLVQLFAEALGATESNRQFNLIPVRPDWSDPSDLIGYRDLTGRFKPGRLTQVFLTASQPENKDKPYFVCLDEMNLARVEHYFSDLLSVMETRRWQDGRIITDILVGEEELQALKDPADSIDGPRQKPTSVGIPDNVYLIGTVNMDETTYPFSKKVLDRAQTLEFNEIDLNQLPLEEDEALEFNGLNLAQSFLASDYLILRDAFPGNEALIQRTTERLVEINEILAEVHANIGFRVRDAVCIYLVYNQRFGLLAEDESFDLQLLQKILPRLQGSHSSLKRVLIQLMAFAVGQRLNVEELMEDASELYLRWRSQSDQPAARFAKSSRKIAYMLRRMEEDGFTSFWLT
ncbi:DUF3578 domain-containing protein [Desulfosporosinus sp. FKA]|uniref:MrcB family domain-containing protein n=1 Tax=Desulfosporosinus sp. FKA TaxID=1969834 RepID=UPI000B4A14CD|nr:DUF3578 domain-containing protein [Desulfosporosinus sp. FKA]